ncbi:hypothetical protein ANCDUO_27192 [Ancylostoma duodenale]|uniref:Uncharacterized protein n=1 Tax=Ancylostoma duodenale TaxID=51022 RepID=A0A0C2BGF5_9BILA|nr:hypothetical protein ANCDUO_27192 [Ancylostoma duodenale]
MSVEFVCSLYGMESTQAQVDALICLLKTKNHWVGPMTDALIRNGQVNSYLASLEWDIAQR